MALLFIAANPVVARGEEEVKRVLLLNSYHTGFTWNDKIIEGITNNLESPSFKTVLSTEYMDWKNYPSPENIKNFYQNIKYKYGKSKIDLVITSDNAATDFALQYRKELFPNASIVFCGLYKEVALKIYQSNENITGVIENIDSEGTIRAALKIYPRTKSIYVIHEQTESGIESLNNVRDAANMVDTRLKVHSVDTIDFNDSSTFPNNLPKDSILILTTLFRDKNGQTDSAENIVQLLSHQVSQPIFYVYEMGLGHGIIGGSLLSPKVHGERTARIALKILEGEKASNIIPYQSHDRVMAFDYEVLKKFNISTKALPEGSKISNLPISFYEKNRELVMITLSIFIIMLIFIFSLLLNINKRKKVESMLKVSYDELNALYEELAATEEALRYQYEELEQNKELLEKNEEKYRLVFKASNEGLWDYDLISNEVYFSGAWYKNFSLPEDKKYTQSKWYGLIHPDDRIKVNNYINSIKEGIIDKYETEIRVRKRDGEYIWILAKGIGMRDENGQLIRLAGSYQDIHLKKTQEEKIKQLAYFDGVTGLPNRFSFYEWLEAKLGQEEILGGAVLFIDLDNFKVINDAFGHVFGDRFLKEVAQRIQVLQKQNNLVARLGGDEFVIAVDAIEDLDEVITYAKSLLKLFEEPFFLDDNELVASASVGIALYPSDGKTIAEILRKADSAMYKAKKLGKNNFTLFDDSIEEELYSKILLSHKLRGAIERGELEVFYQPQLHIGTNKIYGFEALSRWKSPEYGFVSPLTFISLAEESGQIISIGEWVLKKSCLFAVDINENRKEKIIISVNISSVQLMQRDFVDTIQRVIEETGLDPTLLGLEITESILMESFVSNANKLQLLKNMGVKISLDDFGTGYSSLNYLRQLPINTLKIDKAFIDDLIVDEKVKCLTESIVEIAHNMGFEVVAEGVETQEQLTLLRNYRCNIVQGYLVSKPKPEQEARKILDSGIFGFD